MLIRIPLKYVISKIIGYLEGKSVIAVARGYAVSAVGFELHDIKAYVKNQEQLDREGFNESGEF